MATETNLSPLHLKVFPESLKLCQYLEEHIVRVPGVNLRKLDDDGGHGSKKHILNLMQNGPTPSSEAIRQRILNEFCDAGPLVQLMGDPEITEILINNRQEIWFERQGQLQTWPDHFFSDFTYNNFIQRIYSEAEVHIDLHQPAIDGFWRGFRFHAIGTPLVEEGPCLCLRRHPENAWTLEELSRRQWASPSICQKIADLVEQHQTLLIVGTTGSGKTSVLSACLQKITSNERALILEDTKEIALPNSVSLRLLTREDLRSQFLTYDLADLLRQSLRMRPDRIIMGEVRGPEAKDLLLTLSTGHRGGLATLHAKSPHEALMRLEVLIQLGAPQWHPDTVKKLILHGLQYVILTQRQQNQRQFAGAFRICSLESSGFLVDREF